MVLLNKPLSNKHKLLVIATTSCLGVIEDMGLSQIFTRALKVPIITKLDEIEVVVKVFLKLISIIVSFLRKFGKKLLMKWFIISFRELIFD